jgi:hypothetical protein
MNYLILDLEVKKANMLQSPSVVSPAPVFAAVMAMHALDKRLPDPLGVAGVGIVHQTYSPCIEMMPTKSGYLDSALVQRRGGCIFGFGDFKREKGSGPQQNSIQPSAFADYHWKLVVACRNEVPRAKLDSAVLQLRFAGGVIERAAIAQYDEWERALASLRSGFWVDDVTDTIEESPNPVQQMLDVTCKPGWNLPATLGYALLERPRDRAGARDGKRHAFAEAMLGLVSFTPVALAKDRGLTPDCLWRYGWDEDQFIVTNRSGVSLSASPAF